MSTIVYKGKKCVTDNLSKIELGKKCIIVTGKSSAVKSGALDDIKKVLEEKGTEYTIYNGIIENPTFEVCYEAGKIASEFGAEFVIGVGGGSVIDASKAAAAIALCPELDEETLLAAGNVKEALPIIAIPLTAGTGSEVNPFSVITVEEKKKSFSSMAVLPKFAFLEPKYLKTLNREYTISTAIDAFCHCYESYLSPKSTKESEKEALFGGKILWKMLTTNDFQPREDDLAGLTLEQRLELLEAAAAGGRAIMTTGTGFPHPLGYGLSLEYKVPHGFACGAFTGKYTEYNLKTELGKQKIECFAEYIGATPELIAEVIPALSDVNLSLSDEEIADFVAKVSGAKNYTNSPAVIGDKEATEIFRELF
ncbi:MAG: iron-containing alcohol dehydrogenase [Clostridia bacterium]|nr:iron-containing alcohol dehydrogenase [Clostridia bacterium]